MARNITPSNQEGSLKIEVHYEEENFKYLGYFSQTLNPDTENAYHMIFIITNSSYGNSATKVLGYDELKSSYETVANGKGNAEVSVIDMNDKDGANVGGPVSTNGTISKPDKGLPR
jgi:hypothetical protein